MQDEYSYIEINFKKLLVQKEICFLEKKICDELIIVLLIIEYLNVCIIEYFYVCVIEVFFIIWLSMGKIIYRINEQIYLKCIYLIFYFVRIFNINCVKIM